MLKAAILAIVLLTLPLSAPALLQAADTQPAHAGDAAAIARYQAAVSQQPGDYQAWFGLGVAQARQRHFQDAITAFRRVITLQPSLAEPHNNLAVIYNELGDLRAAVAELETSLKLDPAYTTAYENIGDLYVKLAANAYQQALQKNAGDALRQRYTRLLHLHDPLPLSAEGAGKQAPAPLKSAASAQITPTLSAEGAVLSALEAWRAAWSRRDIAAYFDAYAADFEPGRRFGSLAAWKKYKQTVIAGKAFIRVTLEQIKPVQQAEGFRVTFTQHFRSDALNSDDQKELLFKQTPDGWKIVHETTR